MPHYSAAAQHKFLRMQLLLHNVINCKTNWDIEDLKPKLILYKSINMLFTWVSKFDSKLFPNIHESLTVEG